MNSKYKLGVFSRWTFLFNQILLSGLLEGVNCRLFFVVRILNNTQKSGFTVCVEKNLIALPADKRRR